MVKAQYTKYTHTRGQLLSQETSEMGCSCISNQLIRPGGVPLATRNVYIDEECDWYLLAYLKIHKLFCHVFCPRNQSHAD